MAKIAEDILEKYDPEWDHLIGDCDGPGECDFCTDSPEGDPVEEAKLEKMP